ncbi:MAG: protocatechuate 3,4-dioxygenase subunit beta [Subtercola sp.]|nr:protocatechuate 3,4-dioxygenase subunit beta [Subtercola sp.]
MPNETPTAPHIASQSTISAEIAAISAQAKAATAAGAPPELQARRDYPPYRSSTLRHPTHALVKADPEEIERTSPAFGHTDVDDYEADLTVQHSGEPLGERIIVTGKVLDGEGRPVRNQLLEIWQANASGRYVHKRDQHPAPLDPNFTGVGRVITGDDGSYRLVTIKPGAYPWKNHTNAWRPAHIHFSLFGTAFTQRLVTQMYFPGDPLFALDPIYQSVVDPAAQQRMVSQYDHDVSVPEWAIGYRWNIVLTGPKQTWMEQDDDHE